MPLGRNELNYSQIVVYDLVYFKMCIENDKRSTSSKNNTSVRGVHRIK